MYFIHSVFISTKHNKVNRNQSGEEIKQQKFIKKNI